MTLTQTGVQHSQKEGMEVISAPAIHCDKKKQTKTYVTWIFSCGQQAALVKITGGFVPGIKRGEKNTNLLAVELSTVGNLGETDTNTSKDWS